MPPTTFLTSHNTLSLATAGPDGTPHAAAVFYAVADDLTLYFLSEPKTLHAQHIGAGARVAGTIEANDQDWKSIRGLQLHGWAEPCSGIEEERARAVYAARFPFVARASDVSIATLAGPLSRARYYKLTPTWIRLIDNTLGFGHKEEWGVEETQGGGDAGRGDR
ncbi:MAG: pyridoxamine 5'-phosphate oxidase family protein [Caldilineales bacterium]|nr:pyridoxamine 5'-phosphate oxidase family protein [Caldilineales bacterium]